MKLYISALEALLQLELIEGHRLPPRTLCAALIARWRGRLRDSLYPFQLAVESPVEFSSYLETFGLVSHIRVKALCAFRMCCVRLLGSTVR